MIDMIPDVELFYVTIYDTVTGRIIGNAQHSGCASFAVPSRNIDETAGTFSGDTHFYSSGSGTCITRPDILLDMTSTSIKADGVSQCSMNGIPAGALVTTDGLNPQTCDDGVLEFTATHAGQYVIVVSAFPYLDRTVTVTAT